MCVCVFWLGLWHINHCKLFDAKSSLYMYIKYVQVSLAIIVYHYIGYKNVSSQSFEMSAVSFLTAISYLEAM